MGLGGRLVRVGPGLFGYRDPAFSFGEDFVAVLDGGFALSGAGRDDEQASGSDPAGVVFDLDGLVVEQDDGFRGFRVAVELIGDLAAT